MSSRVVIPGLIWDSEYTVTDNPAEFCAKKGYGIATRQDADTGELYYVCQGPPPCNGQQRVNNSGTYACTNDAAKYCSDRSMGVKRNGTSNDYECVYRSESEQLDATLAAEAAAKKAADATRHLCAGGGVRFWNGDLLNAGTIVEERDIKCVASEADVKRACDAQGRPYKLSKKGYYRCGKTVQTQPIKPEPKRVVYPGLGGLLDLEDSTDDPETFCAKKGYGVVAAVDGDTGKTYYMCKGTPAPSKAHLCAGGVRFWNGNLLNAGTIVEERDIKCVGGEADVKSACDAQGRPYKLSKKGYYRCGKKVAAKQVSVTVQPKPKLAKHLCAGGVRFWNGETQGYGTLEDPFERKIECVPSTSDVWRACKAKDQSYALSKKKGYYRCSKKDILQMDPADVDRRPAAQIIAEARRDNAARVQAAATVQAQDDSPNTYSVSYAPNVPAVTVNSAGLHYSVTPHIRPSGTYAVSYAPAPSQAPTVVVNPSTGRVVQLKVRRHRKPAVKRPAAKRAPAKRTATKLRPRPRPTYKAAKPAKRRKSTATKKRKAAAKKRSRTVKRKPNRSVFSY
jgi:hypothetical protein